MMRHQDDIDLLAELFSIVPVSSRVFGAAVSLTAASFVAAIWLALRGDE